MLLFTNCFSRCLPKNRIAPLYQGSSNKIRDDIHELELDIINLKKKLKAIKTDLQNEEQKRYSARNRITKSRLYQNIVSYRQKYLQSLVKMIEYLYQLSNFYSQLKNQSNKLDQIDVHIRIHQVLVELLQNKFNTSNPDISLIRTDSIIAIQAFKNLLSVYKPLDSFNINDYMLDSIRDRILKRNFK